MLCCVVLMMCRAERILCVALDAEDEHSKPTCACWVGERANCFAVGYDDGSILVWAMPPAALQGRHAVVLCVLWVELHRGRVAVVARPFCVACQALHDMHGVLVAAPELLSCQDDHSWIHAGSCLLAVAAMHAAQMVAGSSGACCCAVQETPSK